MATTWTSSALTTSNKYIKYKIIITENSTSTSANTSSVTVKVQFYRTNTGYTTYGSGTVYVTIDGTSYTASVSSSDKITNSGIVLFNKTVTITHDSDGSKSLKVAAYISHSQFSSSSQSYTVTLTTIARASSITSASAVTLGNAVSVKFTPLSTSFYYKLSFTCGGHTATTSAFKPGTTSAYTYTSYTMSIATWAPYITTATTATCTVKLYTYSDAGTTQVGSASSTTFTVTVPTTVVPTVSNVVVSEGNSDVSNAGMTIYLSGKSKLKVTVTATMSYDSAISSITVKVGSNSYTATLTTTSTGATGVATGAAVSATSVEVTVTVKDKRGRSATYTTTVTQTAYTEPTVSEFLIVRCDEDGTENTQGIYVKITYKYTVTSITGNTSSMTLQWAYVDESDYTLLTSESGIFAGSETVYVSTATFAAESGFTFVMTVADAVSTTVKTFSLSTALTIIDAMAGGKGVAFGKVATEEGWTDSDWPIKADGFVIPQIQCGLLSSQACPAGATTDFDIKFDKEFGGTPIVLVGIASTTTSATGYSTLTVFVSNISKTGFTLRVTNGGSSSYSPAFRYIAMYAY